MRRFGYCDLQVGDVLTSKDNDFMLVGRVGEKFMWLDLHEKAFDVDLDPTSNVPAAYTVLRGRKIVRKGLE